ncbi:hypothetical protein B0T24DRAFT_600428 [Lasiosphaeria ovina]|uniref:Uncharacterized protein n=1 Tax=Lasiosphaeria ovina TaxID=92902 RepID=A0AAE0TWK8_9PEZI|nr:hypothetical protein B0T24DRAFT_600428 [Lasiosphaeria ovina]
MTTLLAHVCGVKNVYTCMIRLYAVYHLHNQPLYDLAMWIYAGVIWLYVTEMLVWKTVRLREGSIALATAGPAFVWMFLQRGWYLH